MASFFVKKFLDRIENKGDFQPLDAFDHVFIV